MLSFNSRILTFAALSLVLYLMISSIDLSPKHSNGSNHKSYSDNQEKRIEEIRKEITGKNKIENQGTNTIHEKVVYFLIDSIAGEEFRKKMLHNG
jgi:hypothetical protein